MRLHQALAICWTMKTRCFANWSSADLAASWRKAGSRLWGEENMPFIANPDTTHTTLLVKCNILHLELLNFFLVRKCNGGESGWIDSFNDGEGGEGKRRIYPPKWRGNVPKQHLQGIRLSVPSSTCGLRKPWTKSTTTEGVCYCYYTTSPAVLREQNTLFFNSHIIPYYYHAWTRKNVDVPR